LIIREVEKRDCEELGNFYGINFKEHVLVYRNILSNPKELEKEIEREDKKWLIAELNKRIVGSSCLEVSDWNSAAEIERVATAIDMRRNGIAKTLCKTLTYEIAEPIGVKYIFALARGPEYGMQKALHDLEFKIHGVSPEFYVNHNGREVRENFVKMGRFLNDGELEIESYDKLIPIAKDIKDIIDKQYK
jgi:N-acetylglutamate synthase-like GNAT family acetyltransferase